MGASSWSYLVPFQPDIDKALQELRQQVFEDGSYYKPAKWYRLLYERGIIDDQKLQNKLKELELEPEPKTIQQLIQLRGHEGTHSIIDIEKISLVPTFRAISPLTQQELKDLFGSDRPTREMVKQKAEDLQVVRDRWQGVYVVIYKGESPSEIFFTGISGD